MARFCPLFSGSSGNSIYIGAGDTHILIDAGVSARRISNALKEIRVMPEDISAIFVTHQHNDHICGLKNFSQKHNIPIYASKDTARALSEIESTAELSVNTIETEIELGGLKVSRFETSHDCVGSSGYRVDFSDGRAFGVCTDTGVVTDDIRAALKGCELVLLESNHDVTRLASGPYPIPLKRRILSDCGHLSNGSCAKELPNLVAGGTSRIILGHISAQNNTNDAITSSALAELLSAGYTEGEDYILYIAPPSGGKLFSL